MANYRPKSITVTAQASGIAINKTVNTDGWGLFLLKGTAVGAALTNMVSGCVQVWEDGDLTTGTATHTTFTDELGRYGVTCKAGTQLVVKFLGK